MIDYQKELLEQIRRFRTQKIDPHVEEDEKNEYFNMEIFTEMGRLGLTGITTPQAYGGMELGYQDLCLVLCELAKSSVSYAVTISVSSMVQGIINRFGTELQKKTYIPALASGEEIGAFGLTESHSGSDAASLRTTATETSDGFVLNGTKMFITSAGIAKTYIIMARTSGAGPKGISAFIVRDGTPGFSYGKTEKKMGWKVSPTRELIFNQCKIPKDHLLGELGQGFKISMAALDRGRITIGSIANGLSKAALGTAIAYSLERKQFGQEIFQFQGLQFMIAEMATEVESSKLLVLESARLFDQGANNTMLASMAKLKATETCMKVTTDSLQILGGVGYTTEFPVERYMRDAKVLQIVEGTNQIQKIVIARELKNHHKGLYNGH